MQHQIFISYAGPDQELVENFRSELKLRGINAWVYSLDKTIGSEIWNEIEDKIQEISCWIFIISNHSVSSNGQLGELKLVLQKVTSAGVRNRIIPLFWNEINPSDCPEPFNQINGEFLDAESVKTTAFKIAERFFPDLLERESLKEWKYPCPGEWLKISKMDRCLEKSSYQLGDKLYFRKISPIRLFECYSPKIKGLYSISPENVVRSVDIEVEKNHGCDVPYEYSVSGMIHIEQLGWEKWLVDKGEAKK